jgi:hypothetical protein
LDKIRYLPVKSKDRLHAGRALPLCSAASSARRIIGCRISIFADHLRLMVERTREPGQLSCLNTSTWRNPLFCQIPTACGTRLVPADDDGGVSQSELPTPPSRSCRYSAPLLVWRPRGAGPLHTPRSPKK